MNELSGGELATRLTAAQRMALIENGYNPLSPRDVKAFQAGQRPQEGIAALSGAGQKEFSNLGMSRASANDLRRASSEYGLDTSMLDQDSMSMLNDELGSGYETPRNPREAISQRMDNYGGGGDDLNAKLQARLSAKNVNIQPNGGSYPSGFQEENDDIIDNEYYNSPRAPQTKQLLRPSKPAFVNDKAAAEKTGFAKGLNYINAFIINLKTPSVENRNNIIDMLNQMSLAEDKIHPSIRNYFHNGIAKAEKLAYDKIKGKNG